MQREMKWFKEGEKLVHPYSITIINDKGKTARELFSEEHKQLLAETGEKWMKDTSNSGMIVGTLIAAAGFTVPGGNNSDTGVPIFLRTNAFLVFAMAEEDFRRSLPKRLIIGLASLFLAISTMMVAFGATLSIVLN